MAGAFEFGIELDATALPNFQQQFDDFVYEDVEIVSQYVLPDPVKHFVLSLHKHILGRNIAEIQALYETQFSALTQKFFKEEAWPSAEVIAPLVKNDAVFVMLYRELYYRHVHSQLKPTLDHRLEAYDNYVDLFNYLLEPHEPVSLELPNVWLWDMIDEFIYQFQVYRMYRTKLTPADEKDVPTLVANPQAWDVLVLINVFQSLVSKSRINEQLVAIRNGEDPVTVAGHFGCRTLYKMLGYFSLVGLLRLHSLLGDYHTALRSFENVELNKKGLYSRVPKCQITIFYYVGFAYMMMRRYQDSVRMFAGILTYILRTQPYHTRSSGYDFLIKKKDHLLALLAIVLVLAPQRIDDALHTQLLEKHGEKMVKMQRGDDSVFPVVQELFSIGCPKFVSPVISAPRIQTAKENSSLDPLKLQMKLFLTEVTQQVLTPFVRSYLKLYSTMPIVKLAAFLNLVCALMLRPCNPNVGQ